MSSFIPQTSLTGAGEGREEEMQKQKTAESVRSAVELKLDVHPKDEVAGSLPLLIL